MLFVVIGSIARGGSVAKKSYIMAMYSTFNSRFAYLNGSP